MKKRFLILSSLITLLLTCFSLPIYADEDPTDPPSSVPVPNSIRLDQYFFDNYDLLPYIESDGNQYLDTGISASSTLRVNADVSDLKGDNSYRFIFGYLNQLAVGYRIENSFLRFAFNNNEDYFQYSISDYVRYSILFDENKVYINNSLIKTFTDGEFSSSDNIRLFTRSSYNDALGSFKLYSFSIYDYSTESYLRYYYPAKSKAGNVIGLYDAVSDTFVTTAGSVPFDSPVNDQVFNFQIGNFVTSSLGWIGQILTFVVETPIILIFMAIGLAGAMFRWGRRLVHF